MNRLVLARGARGELVKRVQRGLAFDERDTDGIYGGQTEDGVRDFQERNGLQPTGKVDTVAWERITGRPLPALFERALGITADFEGHGFDLIQGNFDGAGLTWGIIGFTLKHGELSAIVLEMNEARPDLVRLAFNDLAPELVRVMKAPLAEQMAFADSISIGPKKVKAAEPWLSSFALFGRLPEVQDLQLRRAREKYFDPAQKTAGRLSLGSELGVALCFDIHVQNGGVKKNIEARLRELVFSSEKELRMELANAVADASRPKFQADVRSRKLTLAEGKGKVHGTMYDVPSWGLDELPAA